MHSDWSDGHDPMEAMARAAVELGYEYIAITDHSPHAATRRTVDADRLQCQADEIRRVQQRVPSLTILHGVEVDILPDGELDRTPRRSNRSTSWWHRCTTARDRIVTS